MVMWTIIDEDGHTEMYNKEDVKDTLKKKANEYGVECEANQLGREGVYVDRNLEDDEVNQIINGTESKELERLRDVQDNIDGVSFSHDDLTSAEARDRKEEAVEELSKAIETIEVKQVEENARASELERSQRNVRDIATSLLKKDETTPDELRGGLEDISRHVGVDTKELYSD